MKKTIYGLLFLSLAGIVSCEKESLEKNTEATTEVRQNLEKANAKNYAVGANPTSLELLRKEYNINTGVFGSGASLNNLLYYGVGAYDDDIAALGETGTGFSDITYRSGIGNHRYGLVKLNGADFLLDEIELIDDDINKLYGLRNGTIYKLTYNTGSGNFDASHLYTYIGPKPLPTRFTIAPVISDNVSIRFYYATTSQLNYIDINTATLTLTPPTTILTTPLSGDLSSFTAKDYFYSPPLGSGYYIVFGKDIYHLNTSTSFIFKSSFNSPVNDCSFYAQ